MIIMVRAGNDKLEEKDFHHRGLRGSKQKKRKRPQGCADLPAAGRVRPALDDSFVR